MTNHFDLPKPDPVIREIISVLRDEWLVTTSLDEETSVNVDLGIAGEEAEKLIVELAAKFEIDLTSFRFRDYFYTEEEVTWPWANLAYRVFGICKPRSLKPLRIIDLARASHGGAGGYRL